MCDYDLQVTIDDPVLATSLLKSGLGNAPVGHLLRLRVPDRWVRFHFFKSKRYPDNKEDDALVFAKFTVLGNRLFGSDESIKACVWTQWTDEEGREHGLCRSRDSVWSPLAWREHLLDMAHFETDDFTLLSHDASVALSCCDGGFDVFARDTAGRDGLRAEFAEWLSERADGL